jgi:hypothetical protein
MIIPNFESSYQHGWQISRINFMNKILPYDFFEDKTVLELGAFNGFIGNFCHVNGAKVTCVEGREENANGIRTTFPHLNVFCDNLDTKKWKYGKFDIIINYGLLYHLENFHKEFLINCIKNSKTMLLESVIFDSFEDEIYFRHEEGIDQSLSPRGGTPSTLFVENILKSQNTKYEKFTSSELNYGAHYYDWIDKNSKHFDGYSRRMWKVENN